MCAPTHRGRCQVFTFTTERNLLLSGHYSAKGNLNSTGMLKKIGPLTHSFVQKKAYWSDLSFYLCPGLKHDLPFV